MIEIIFVNGARFPEVENRKISDSRRNKTKKFDFYFVVLNGFAGPGKHHSGKIGSK